MHDKHQSTINSRINIIKSPKTSVRYTKRKKKYNRLLQLSRNPRNTQTDLLLLQYMETAIHKLKQIYARFAFLEKPMISFSPSAPH
jgi:hypothetical protein